MAKRKRSKRVRKLLKAAKDTLPMVAGVVMLSACETVVTGNPKGSGFDSAIAADGGTTDAGDSATTTDTGPDMEIIISSNPKGSMFDSGLVPDAAVPDAGEPDAVVSSNPKGSMFDQGLMDMATQRDAATSSDDAAATTEADAESE